MKKYFFYCCSIGFLFSCSNADKNIATSIGDTNEIDTTITFFPVTSFIKGQLLILDSLPVTVLQVTTKYNKSDSLWISTSKLRAQLDPFISTEINETNLRPFFKQTKFRDQGIDAFTFTYEPISNLPDSILLRHWDIYINPEKGIVKRVYLLKKFIEAGQNYTHQLTWQTNKWAKIVTILNRPEGNSEIVNEIKFIWDLSDE